MLLLIDLAGNDVTVMPGTRVVVPHPDLKWDHARPPVTFLSSLVYWVTGNAPTAPGMRGWVLEDQGLSDHAALTSWYFWNRPGLLLKSVNLHPAPEMFPLHPETAVLDQTWGRTLPHPTTSQSQWGMTAFRSYLQWTPCLWAPISINWKTVFSIPFKPGLQNRVWFCS